MKERLLLFLFGFMLMSFLALPAYLLQLEEVKFASGSSLWLSIDVWKLMLCVFFISQVFYWNKVTQIFDFLNSKNYHLIFNCFMPYARIFPVWLMLFIAILFGKSDLDIGMRFIMLFVIAIPVLCYMIWMDTWCKKNMPDHLNRYGDKED